MAERAHWKSRFGFILAAAGSAIGLGNIWKFPYITGENGGGLFVLIYLVCIVLVGLPIMMAEIMIGRAAQKQPVGAFRTLQGGDTSWTAIGCLGVVTGFIILSYYSVVAGWAMDYTLKSMVNFSHPIHRQAEIQATKYKASAEIPEIKTRLIDEELSAVTRAEANRIKARAKPSVWKDYEKYEQVIAEGDAESARRRLFEDHDFEANIEKAEQLKSDIAAMKNERREAIRKEIDALPEEELLQRAEASQRRKITFEKISQAFDATENDGWTSAFWSLLFMLATILIVGGGISGGIERACRILMPTLFSLVCFMVLYGMTQPGFAQGFSFVFRPDPTKLKPSGVLEALGHAFFTLSLGMGAMITYGSYQAKKGGLAYESTMIAVLDTVIALLACLMIFPIIFTYGEEPTAGPGLVFKSMPLAFSEIPYGGMLLAIVFFSLLFFAALTSAISLLEVVASYFIDQRGWSRPRAAWITGGAIFVFGIPSAFAEDPRFGLTGWAPSYGMSFFETMDYLASNWLLPVGGLFTALYAGWVMPANLRDAECADMPRWMYWGWLGTIRVLTPCLVVVVLLQKVGILDIDQLLTW